jgi:hypothetical protein
MTSSDAGCELCLANVRLGSGNLPRQ